MKPQNGLYQIKFGEHLIEYSIKRRNRTTVGILIDPVKGVVISAHPDLDAGELREIVLKRAGWIIDKQNQLRNKISLKVPKKFVEGECFWYLGNQYPLYIQKSDPCQSFGLLPRIDFQADAFWIFLPGRTDEEERISLIRSAFLRWYFAKAEEIILEKINIRKKDVMVNPHTIRVRHQKCCWGSCTGKNALHFNWRLILSPLPVIDYVVVHELCHLRVKNHSPQFWSLVRSIVPDYQDRKAWLRQNSIYLDI
ncbi:MAG: SprT family zinc-dependent metalloprotease [bacterium]